MSHAPRSSNPEGRAAQAAIDESGGRVEDMLPDDIGKLNAMLAAGEIEPIGAVAGPAHIEPELDLTGAHALFLAPGAGARGATPHDVARVSPAFPERVMPSASRSLLIAGPGVNDLRGHVAAMAGQVRRVLLR